jgi:N-acetylglucosamine kinase-like BadF-type ATPase
MQLTKGASNPNDVGLQRASEILCDGIREITKMFPTVRAVFCGIAGALTGEYKCALTERIKVKFPNLKVKVDTDIANLFALDELSDIAVISGTGSVVYVKHNTEKIRLGGWGYLFDGAGSAYDIGREAVRVALYEEDKRLPRSKTSTLLLEKLNADMIWDVIESFYKGGKPYIASMAEVVFRAYSMGDEKAIRIIDESAKRLAEFLEEAVEQYNVRPRAVAGGGVFTNCQSIMLTHIKKYTSVKINVCELPQVYGACRESLRLLGEDVSDKFYHNFKSSYGVFEQ